VIDFIVLNGPPTDPPETPGSVWQRLDEIRRTPLLHASGRPIMISAYGIDAGGANTQDVYNYGSARMPLNCTVLHGSSRPNKPIMGSSPSRVDIEWGGSKTPGGVELWTVGTDVAKDWLSNRMHLAEGAGAMHFNQALPIEWFDQMVVEQPRVRWHKGRAIREWIKPNGKRNEAWDVSVYNLAIAHQLGLHKWTPLDWQRLRDKLIPPIGDLFAPVAATNTATQPPAAPADLPVQTSVPAERVNAAPAAQPLAPPTPSVPLPPIAPSASAGRRIYSKGIQ
jgi:phage terminase large subunit GpA-like protein